MNVQATDQLLSIFGLTKVFELCVLKYVLNFFRDNILTNLQTGLMPGDTAVYLLKHLYDCIANALESQKELFCDVSKAF